MKLRCYNCLINQKLFSQIRSVIFHALALYSFNFHLRGKMSVQTVQIIRIYYLGIFLKFEEKLELYLQFFPFFYCVKKIVITRKKLELIKSNPPPPSLCFEFVPFLLDLIQKNFSLYGRIRKIVSGFFFFLNIFISLQQRGSHKEDSFKMTKSHKFAIIGIFC